MKNLIEILQSDFGSNLFNAINERIPIRYRVIHTVIERKNFCKHYILPVYKHKDGTYKNY